MTRGGQHVLPFGLALLLMTVACFRVLVPAALASTATNYELQVFVRPGCPYCEQAKSYLTVLQQRRSDVTIRIRDISADAAAAHELGVLAERFGIRPVGVPAFYLRDRLLVGFLSAETTGKQIEALLNETPLPQKVTPRDSSWVQEVIEMPLFGPIAVRDLGLPLFTITLGLLDGFNPCAMWVLVFILSMLVNLRSRSKMFLIGGVFVLVSGVVYFAFMAAWLNLFLLVGVSRLIQYLLGGVALVVGILNLKDFIAFRRGPSLGIPEAAKPGIYAQVRKILQAENILGAVAAVIVLAVLVNTVELLCTAGLPAVYTRMLTLHALPTWAYYGYLALYNLAYIADDSLMLTVAVITLSRERLQERGARWLKLISGVVLLLLGTVLLWAPGWLSG